MPWRITIEIDGDTSPEQLEAVIQGISDILDVFEVQATVSIEGS